MGWINDELSRRKLPELLEGVKTAEDFMSRRKEIQKLLEEEEYGHFPPKPVNISFKETSSNSHFAAGHAVLSTVEITSTFPDGQEFTFPVRCAVPKKGDDLPAFVHIAFTDLPVDKYMPTEEIIDNGFAVFAFCIDDVQTNDHLGDFSNGLGPILFPDGHRGPHGASKLTMWAWAAMRVMDYIETLKRIDKSSVAVMGHSRLGKTALIAGGWDERFQYVFSNDSGCGGAALSRCKTGETLEFMSNVLWFWYDEKFLTYEGDPFAMPFDQHFLIALSAPRHVVIASASLDDWAHPAGEYLGAVAASPAWELFGKKGLVGPDRAPEAGDTFYEGDVGYHCRDGVHFLSRYDWNHYMDYIRLHRGT